MKFFLLQLKQNTSCGTNSVTSELLTTSRGVTTVFSPDKKVDVKFTDDYGISEGTVDNGGPTREFFRLCLHEIKDKIGIFEGPPDAKVLTCNSKGIYD